MKPFFQLRGFWDAQLFGTILASVNRVARAGRSAGNYRPTLETLEDRTPPTAVPFFTPPPISTTANSATSVAAADVDGDGDTDVLSASALDNKIAWYENDGITPPAFTLRTAHG